MLGKVYTILTGCACAANAKTMPERTTRERKRAMLYQALDHFGPAFSFISRRELLMPASTSIFLAKSQSKSESRLRYARIFGLTASPDSINRTTPRSALRQTVLARS